MKIIKFLTSRIGPIVTTVTYAVTIITFLIAYMSPDKTVLVTINQFNEANLELIFFIITLPWTVRFLFKAMKEDI